MVRIVFRVALALSCVGLLATAIQQALAKPISISQRQDLAFGTVAISAAQGGTVVINAATGNKTVTAGATDLGGTHGRAEFQVAGDKNAAFTITLPTSITLTAASGPGTATVDNFTSSPTSPATLPPPNGRLTVFVGATLNLVAGHDPESYTGTFDVIVNYQ